jgi:hypothetical protein
MAAPGSVLGAAVAAATGTGAPVIPASVAAAAATARMKN